MKNFVVVLLIMLFVVSCEELTDSTDTFSISVDGGAVNTHDEGLIDPLVLAAQDTNTGLVTIWFMQGFSANTTTFSQTLIMTAAASGGTGTFTIGASQIAGVYGIDVNASSGGGTYFAVDPAGNSSITLSSNGGVGDIVAGTYTFDLCSYDPAGPTMDCASTKTVSGSFSATIEDTTVPTGLGL